MFILSLMGNSYILLPINRFKQEEDILFFKEMLKSKKSMIKGKKRRFFNSFSFYLLLFLLTVAIVSLLTK